jgi:hypothetical protein
LRTRAMALAYLVLLVTACSRFFGDQLPDALSPAEAKRVTVDVVARNNQCEPSVLAVDREGRAVMITFRVSSLGKEHFFLIPDLSVRQPVPADSQIDIQLLADRSGIYQYACNSQRWIGPFATTGKLAIR